MIFSFKISKIGLANQSEKLGVILSDEIIDATSYKYRNYDDDEGRIYDPYKHFRELGISFKTNNYDNIYRAKLSLKYHKIYQSLNFHRKLFNFDSFYLTQNQFFVLEQPSWKFTGSFSNYHLAVNYYYQSNGLREPSPGNVIWAYYQTYHIPSKKKFVICTEDEFQTFGKREKKQPLGL